MTRRHKLILTVVIAGLSLTGLFAVFLMLQPPDKSGGKTEFHSANPNDKEFFETAYSFAHKKAGLFDDHVVAGVIPHHLLAADLIANFFQNLEGENYDLVVLVGPNHFLTGQSDIIISAYDWQTPYGILQHDDEALDELLNADLGIKAEEDVMESEHSINSEVAFIKKTFPQATFLPLILKPKVNEQTAEKLAQKLFDIAQGKKTLVLASVDFSHYKNSQQAQQDDKKSISAITNFDFFDIYNIEVDSPPSIYTLLKFSQLSGADFELLDNSNSAILVDKLDLVSTTSYVTGYFVQSKISMLFVGDIMLDRGVKTLIKQKGLDYILGDLATQNFFDGYDLIGGNLEGAVTNGGQYYEPVKEFDFAFSPETVSDLSNYGFTFFNLANNHLNDQGGRGIEETRNNLTSLGFWFSGCRDGVVLDCSSTIVPVKGKKVGMVGLSMFETRLDLHKVQSIINSLKNETDWITVNIHWGEEYDQNADKIQQAIAHQLIDAGADAIVGHHPHVVQEVETYKGKPIFYSLGNFVFDQYFLDEAQEGLAVSLDILGDKINYSLYPLRLLNGRLDLR